MGLISDDAFTATLCDREVISSVLATSGAISSASVAVFFGAKRLCDKVVTDIVSCRRVGDPHEFVRVSIVGVGVEEVLEVSPRGGKLIVKICCCCWDTMARTSTALH
uniref:Uncharacterized protein n=1 Tax=Hyaloperonospora arabidopsidis (strain Emoy2) TaxID=559515 RepID=M4C6R3_HYAAE